MSILKTGDWDKVQQVLQRTPEKLAAATKKALLQEGEFFRGKIVEGLRDQSPGGQAFKALSPLTVAARKLKGFGGSKALIRRGDLRNAVTVKEQAGKVFVGVLRQAAGSDGKPIANIAAMNEYGAGPIIIRITDRMRRFLGVLFRKAGFPSQSKGSKASVGIVVIRIPPRPFIAPVWQKWGQPAEQLGQRFAARLAKLMGGDIGNMSGGVAT